MINKKVNPNWKAEKLKEQAKKSSDGFNHLMDMYLEKQAEFYGMTMEEYEDKLNILVDKGSCFMFVDYVANNKDVNRRSKALKILNNGTYS